MALKVTDLTPRELAMTFTDMKKLTCIKVFDELGFNAQDLITSLAFTAIYEVSELEEKNHCFNQLWQTNVTYLKIISWGWFYFSAILDDYYYTLSFGSYARTWCHKT